MRGGLRGRGIARWMPVRGSWTSQIRNTGWRASGVLVAGSDGIVRMAMTG